MCVAKQGHIIILLSGLFNCTIQEIGSNFGFCLVRRGLGKQQPANISIIPADLAAKFPEDCFYMFSQNRNQRIIVG